MVTLLQICIPCIVNRVCVTVFALVLFFCNSSAAFDFRAVCIGCPEDGTPEAESAHTVAQYVVSAKNY